jgi:hypothetical protein
MPTPSAVSTRAPAESTTSARTTITLTIMNERLGGASVGRPYPHSSDAT